MHSFGPGTLPCLALGAWLLLGPAMASGQGHDDRLPLFPDVEVLQWTSTGPHTNIKLFPLRSGSPLVLPGQRVGIRYATWLLDGRLVDENFSGGVFRFRLGEKTVVSGLESAILNMGVGGKAYVLVPSPLAYGATGQGAVPPAADLVFCIEVLSAR